MATRNFPAWRRSPGRARALAVVLSLALACALSACAARDASGLTVGNAGAAADAALASKPAPVPADVTVTADVPYAGTSDPLQRLDVCAPAASAEAPRPAILLIHGGGWSAGDKAAGGYRELCAWLAQSGFVTFDTDYRLAPAARFPAPLDDLRDALRYVRAPGTVARYGVDPARVGAFGGSAGGNLAALLALGGSGPLTSGERVAALVDLSGPVDLAADALTRMQSRELTEDELGFLGCRDLARCPAAAAASPLRRVDPGDPPVFIGQSAGDFVPPAQGERLRAALERASVPVTLEQIPGDAHSIAVLTPGMRAELLAFLHEQLG